MNKRLVFYKNYSYIRYSSQTDNLSSFTANSKSGFWWFLWDTLSY